jgi:hypothetical protein
MSDLIQGRKEERRVMVGIEFVMLDLGPGGVVNKSKTVSPLTRPRNASIVEVNDAIRSSKDEELCMHLHKCEVSDPERGAATPGR